jgi:hypothetical protein
MTPAMRRTISRYRSILSNYLNQAIATSVANTKISATNHGRKIPYEPDFIARLLLDGIPLFGNALNAVISQTGGSAKITSIFCHGSPQVSHHGSPCELGDILLVHFHTDRFGRTYRNSLLLQAKMSSSPVAILNDPGDLHQLALYMSWGTFQYSKMPGLIGKCRDVSPPNSHLGAQYLLINKNRRYTPVSRYPSIPVPIYMTVAFPGTTLASYQSLGDSILDLLIGANGRTFSDEPTGNIDWCQVVWDLIKVAGIRAFTQRRAGAIKQQRGLFAASNRVTTSFCTSGLASQGNGVFSNLFTPALERWLADVSSGIADTPPPDVDSLMDVIEEDAASSLILIETRELRKIF